MALLLDGDRTSGEDIRSQNVTACVAVANIVRTSLGPVGLDKMLVDQIGDATITNDGATILKMLEVDHPAAKVLVELSERQDKEVGDGTTSVVLLAAELLKRSHELVKQKIHPTTVISGIRLAMREAVKFIKSNMVMDIADLGEEVIMNAAKTSMSSKIIGADDSFFSKLVVAAAMSVEKTMSDGKKKYLIDNVNIIKCPGQSSLQSHLVDGFALQMMRSAQGMPLTVPNAKIALLGFDLRQFRLQQGVQVLVKDVNEMEKIKEKEKDITRDRILKLIKAGANVILTSGGIDDLNAKYLVEHGVMGLRRVPVKVGVQRTSSQRVRRLLLLHSCCCCCRRRRRCCA
jgi:T-complex protein 1 subunit alpha